MPDLNGGRKLAARNEIMKKTDGSAKPTNPSKTKVGDKRKGDQPALQASPKRRGTKRSRSSSSETSDSSSRSGTSDSSASSSSHSSKESPKKRVDRKTTKPPASSKLPPSTQKPKVEPTAAASTKTDAARSQREQPKKPKVDSAKATDSVHTDSQNRRKPTPVTENAQSATTASPLTNTSSSVEEKSKPTKPLAVVKPPSKLLSKVDTTETDKVNKERSKSPVSIPSFTCVLVDKLTRNVNKAHVMEIFSVWGEISNVDMPPDRLHPEFSRCYAYVTYTNPKSAADAVNYMNGGQIDGEIIRVSEVFSRPSTSVRSGGDATTGESTHYRDRTKRDSDRPVDLSRSRRDNQISSSHRRTEGSDERARDHDRPNVADSDRRREAQDRRDRINRDRERERERQQDRDRPRRARRGSSGSPFASRSGPAARQRSPVAGSRCRRTSPPTSRPEAGPRRGRSRTPLAPKARPSADAKPTAGGRRGKNVTRSSSSSSSASGTSNSSSSSSRSGSSSSSSSSSSSRSRT